MTRSKKKKIVGKIYLASKLSIADTLAMAAEGAESKLNGGPKLTYNGKVVQRDLHRFNVLLSCPLECCFCGLKATHGTIEKAANDFVMPFQLNIYSHNTMLTWDHIVPKSLGGSDDPLNGRIACKNCNQDRGNEMELHEMIWAVQQDPHIIYKIEPPQRRSALELNRLVRLATIFGEGMDVAGQKVERQLEYIKDNYLLFSHIKSNVIQRKLKDVSSEKQSTQACSII